MVHCDSSPVSSDMRSICLSAVKSSLQCQMKLLLPLGQGIASVQFGYVVQKRPFAVVTFKRNLSGIYGRENSHYFLVSVGRQRQETVFKCFFMGWSELAVMMFDTTFWHRLNCEAIPVMCCF